MPAQPINPIGFKLQLEENRDIKKALEDWQRQMEIWFAMHPEWNLASCHSYAELSFDGMVRDHMETLRKGGSHCRTCSSS